MSRFLIPFMVLIVLLTGCVPDTDEAPAGSAAQQTIATQPAISEAATAATTLPAPMQEAATSTSTSYAPIVQSDETPTAAPPTSTTTPLPTPTLLATPTATPATGIDAVRLEPVLPGGLTRPLYLTHAFDERLFVVEQAGRIRIIENGQLLPEPFLDLRDRVGSSGNEQGLLSLAFHPGYAQAGAVGYGVFYVNYTDFSGTTTISRFSVDATDPNLADGTSEVILLTVDQPYGNHNGGLLKFGPDGFLYVGLGDGGSAGDPQDHGQSADTLLGSILRLDVSDAGETYNIPQDNPFVNDADRLDEIWAYGVRNPWRFSFDRLTGDLYMGDVGQGQWEEINFQPASSPGGENYGWNIMEGSHCFASATCDETGLVLPVAEYGHNQGCSVTGGYVYRGADFPEMTGNYFFADYCSGIIWRLYPDGSSGWDMALVLESDIALTSFGEDMNGEIYALDRGNGAVFRLIPGP